MLRQYNMGKKRTNTFDSTYFAVAKSDQNSDAQREAAGEPIDSQLQLCSPDYSYRRLMYRIDAL